MNSVHILECVRCCLVLDTCEEDVVALITVIQCPLVRCLHGRQSGAQGGPDNPPGCSTSGIVIFSMSQNQAGLRFSFGQYWCLPYMGIKQKFSDFTLA